MTDRPQPPYWAESPDGIVTIDGGEWLLGAGELNFLEAVPDEMWDWIGEATRKGK